jgi:RNA polymerase sigma factor (sigma-70 family)
MVRKQSAKVDPLLEPLLSPASDEEAGDALSQLISQHAEPVARGIIRYKLHLNPHQAIGEADANDICQEVMMQLVAALRQLRTQPAANPISDLRGLVAVIAHRACSRWMRRQFPERHAFKNRLYYLLTRQRGFAVWQNENRRLMAGFLDWREGKEAASGERLRQLSDDEQLLTKIRSLKIGKPEEWSGALAEIFNHLGGPIEFDRLVHVFASLLQIKDQPLESTDRAEDAGEIKAAGEQPDAAWRVEKRIFLQRLWEEVRQLPLKQRVALLLNLRTPDGQGCIALFPALGIATLFQLAEVLEMSAEKLVELWNELPFEDARIGELLQVSRQQVINARLSARKRLSRRLKGFF